MCRKEKRTYRLLAAQTSAILAVSSMYENQEDCDNQLRVSVCLYVNVYSEVLGLLSP